jgi:hypothetical protein
MARIAWGRLSPGAGGDRWGGPELAAEHSAADMAALLAQLKDEVAAEKERRAKHEARWVEIQNLSQLFIAARARFRGLRYFAIANGGS